jgi:hypothetical protein
VQFKIEFEQEVLHRSILTPSPKRTEIEEDLIEIQDSLNQIKLRGVNENIEKIAAGLKKIREAQNAKGHTIPPQRSKHIPAKVKAHTQKKGSPKQAKKLEGYSDNTPVIEDFVAISEPINVMPKERREEVKLQDGMEEDLNKPLFYLMKKDYENQEVNQKLNQDMRSMIEIMQKTLKELEAEEVEDIKEEEPIGQQTASQLILTETPIQEAVRNKDEPKELNSVYVM